MRSVLVLVLLVACGGKSQPTPAPITNTAPPNAKPAVEPVQARRRPDCNATDEDGGKCAMKFIAYFSAEMCDCKDRACADGVKDNYTKWGTEMAKMASSSRNSRPDPELMKEMAEAVTRYGECFTKIAMAAANAGSAAP